MTVIYAAILFVLLIFPHELGHFLVAKAVGVRVNEFAFGMGPALYKKQKGETLYAIRLVPVGGYCAMEGEDGDSEDERSFGKKPAWAKIAVLLAGAGMNMLIAVLVLTIMAGITGTPTTSIEEVQKGSPAYEAGIREGDRITAVNEKDIEEWTEVQEEIGKAEGKIDITLEREGSSFSASVIPEKSEDGRLIIGIMADREHHVLSSVKNGFITTGNMVMVIFKSVEMLITGEVSPTELAGPVGIMTMVSDTGTYGLSYFGFLVAFISVNLAIMNLLPFPALDGGRILFVIIRGITGKKITDEMEGKIHMLGMVLLLALLFFATWNDIGRLFH